MKILYALWALFVFGGTLGGAEPLPRNCMELKPKHNFNPAKFEGRWILLGLRTTLPRDFDSIICGYIDIKFAKPNIVESRENLLIFTGEGEDLIEHNKKYEFPGSNKPLWYDKEFDPTNNVKARHWDLITDNDKYAFSYWCRRHLNGTIEHQVFIYAKTKKISPQLTNDIAKKFKLQDDYDWIRQKWMKPERCAKFL